MANRSHHSTGSAIRASALRLFAYGGFEATGIRDIARDVGLTPGGIYHYIGTKEDLLIEIMREGISDLFAAAQSALDAAGEAPDARLAALVRAHVRVHGDQQLEALVSDHEVRALTAGNRRTVVQLRDSYEELWRQTIEAGIGQGTFHIDDPALFRLGALQMCTGVAYWYSSDGDLSLSSIADHFAAMVLRMAGVQSWQEHDDELPLETASR